MSMGRTIALARMLSPAAFGLAGIALLLLSSAETITRRNLKAALVQKKGDIRPYLDTAWTMGIVVSGMLAGLMFLVAPLVAGFFHAPEATWVIRVLGLTVLIRELSNIGVVYFEKDLQFHRRFAYQATAMAIEVTVALSLAFTLRNVWAIVLGSVAGSVAQVVVSYAVHPYRPRVRLDIARAVEILRFSRWVVGSSMLVYVVLNLDALIVGRLLGVVYLGFYKMAHSLARVLNVEFAGAISDVAFPAFSRLQGEAARLRSAFLRTAQWTALLMLPFAAGAVVLGHDFVMIVLGEKWLPMVATLQLLAVWGTVWSLGLNFGALYQAVGRPWLGVRHQLVRAAAVIVLVYPMTSRWGMEGAAAGMLAGALVAFPIGLRQAAGAADCSVRAYLKSMVVPGAAALAMAGILAGIRSAISPTPSLAGLAALLAAGTATYAGAVMLLDHVFGAGIGPTLLRTLRAHSAHGPAQR
jgi:O-antigen/teichoic acid export membrane protein